MYRNCPYLLGIRRPAHQTPNTIFNACCRFKSVKSSLKNVTKSLSKPIGGFKTLEAPNVEAPLSPSSLVKPTVFTILFSSASFTGATIWQYENMRHHAREVFRTPRRWFKDKVEPSHLWVREKLNARLQIKQGSLRQLCNSWWNSLTEGQKIFIPLAFVNLLVYGAWKIPALSGLMMRYFVSSSSSKTVCLPMLFSTFSHNAGFHLCINMYVLSSFVSTIVDHLGKEQFLAFYVSAGLCASLSSVVYRVLTRQTGLSLGASGSIMGVIGFYCLKNPDSLLSIAFLPAFVFTAATGIKGIMAIDFTCLLLRFRIFDHAAHLGGALFGIFWCSWGNANIWHKRGPLLEWWHEWRTRPAQ